MIFPDKHLEPYFEQWMNELLPLSVVQLSAEVATKMIRRVTDAMALRIELHCYPKSVTEPLLEYEPLKQLLNQPETFDHRHEDFEQQLNFCWHKLQEISAKRRLAAKPRRPSREFGQKTSDDRNFATAAKEFAAPWTEVFQIAKAVIEKAGNLPTEESIEKEAINRELEEFPRKQYMPLSDFKAQMEDRVKILEDKKRSGQSTPLAADDPRIENMVREKAVGPVLLMVTFLAQDVAKKFPRQLHDAVEAAAGRYGRSQEVDWPSQGWETERKELHDKLDQVREGMSQSHQAAMHEMRALNDEQLARERQQFIEQLSQQQRQIEEHLLNQQQEFDRRLQEEKLSWKQEQRRRRQKRAKKLAATASESVADDTLTEAGSTDDRTLDQCRGDARRRVLKELAGVGPAVIKRVRIPSIERLLDKHLQAATDNAQVVQIENAFSDHAAKLRIREALKARYLKDALLFEDDIPLAQFRSRLRRLLRYRLEFVEFEKNASTIRDGLDEFTGKAGHLRETKEKQQREREEDKAIEQLGKSLGYDPELIEKQKLYSRQNANKT
jgi:hypothetical protein